MVGQDVPASGRDGGVGVAVGWVVPVGVAVAVGSGVGVSPPPTARHWLT